MNENTACHNRDRASEHTHSSKVEDAVLEDLKLSDKQAGTVAVAPCLQASLEHLQDTWIKASRFSVTGHSH